MKVLEKTRKGGAAIVLGVALIGGSLAMAAPAENALGGNCSAWFDNGVGYTRGAGSCSSLNKNTKARVTLDIEKAPDRHSEWFTKLNKTYVTTKWSSWQMGTPRSARVDHAPR